MTSELVDLGKISCYAPNKNEAQFIFKEIFEDHCYDVPGLPDTPFIVDAGANIGLFSLYMKKKYPSAHILAFEPAPQLFEFLCQNLPLNNVSGVETYQYGLASKASTAKLTYFPTLPSNSTLNPAEKQDLYNVAVERRGRELADQWFGGSYEVDVELQRLSFFLENRPSTNNIDLLKIDVEGAELDVLRGIDDAHWPLVQNIVLETYENSGNRGAIVDLLHSKGFTITTEGASWAPKDFYLLKACRNGNSESVK